MRSTVPAGSAGKPVVPARDRVSLAWQVRLLDLLEERPEIADELRALVGQALTQLPTGGVSTVGYGVAAARDVTISASGGAIAAGTIHGT